MTDDIQPKRKSKRRVIVGGAALIVIAVAVGGLLLSGVLKNGVSKQKATNVSQVAERPTFVDLPDIVSNLDTGGRRSSFVKMHVKLQLAHAQEAAAVQASSIQIQDIFQTYLRSMRPEELRGGQGTYLLREALMNRIDSVIAPASVTDLFFTELLVQ